MTENVDIKLYKTSCSYCKNKRESFPKTIHNLPFRSEIQYRIGTYYDFLKYMLSDISADKSLSSFSFSDENAIVSLIKSTAIHFDVATFDLERTVNEWFVQTAVESRSTLELSKSIGVDLPPGLASTTYLNFIIDDSANTIERTVINSGTKAQSLPLDSQLPQIFETSDTIEARPEWNYIKPKNTKTQTINEFSQTIILDGLLTDLSAGHGVLIVKEIHGEVASLIFRLIEKVTLDMQKNQTQIDLMLGNTACPRSSQNYQVDIVSEISDAVYDDENDDAIPPSKKDAKIYNENQNIPHKKKGWDMSQFYSAAIDAGLSENEFLNVLDSSYSKIKTRHSDDVINTTIYTFKIKAYPFGNNAPDFNTLPQEVANQIKITYPNWDDSGRPPLSINKKRTASSAVDIYYGANGKLIYLDNAYSAITSSSPQSERWIVFTSFNSSDGYLNILPSKITNVFEETMLGFSLNSKVNGIIIDIDNVSLLDSFSFRNTTIYVQSETQKLMDIADSSPIKGDSIILDKAYIYLSLGQSVSITGEVLDINGNPSGVTKSEIAVISSIKLNKDLKSVVVFDSHLQFSYKRDSVIINANMVKATHGQSRETILGSGDSSQLIQHFVLREKPLTFVSSSSNPSGYKSTIELDDGVKFNEVSSFDKLYNVDRGFFVRLDEQSFGHIYLKGATSGFNNIHAKYKIGSGKDGLVKAGQISLLLDRPLGVKGVSNPLPALGSEDTDIENAKKVSLNNALFSGRLISLPDFENFVKSFSGIGKSNASVIYSANGKLVYITILSKNWKIVEPDSDLYINLKSVIGSYKDPSIKFAIGSPNIKTFNLKLKIQVDDGFLFESIKPQVFDKLLDYFSFESRQFGQPVTTEEIISTSQTIQGVYNVSVDYFYPSELKKPQRFYTIYAGLPHWNFKRKRVVPAELVIINPNPGAQGIMIEEVKRS